MSAYNHVNQTPLIDMINKKDYNGLLKALQSGADPNAESTPNGVTPLYAAVVKRNMKMIDALLQYGANPYNPPEILDLMAFRKNKNMKKLFIKRHPENKNVFNQHLPSTTPSTNIFNHNYPFTQAFDNNVIVRYKNPSPNKKTIRKKSVPKKTALKKGNPTKKNKIHHFICKQKKTGHYDCVEK